MKPPSNLWKQGKSVIYGLLFIIIFYTIAGYMGWSIYTIYAILLTLITGMLIWKKQFTVKAFFKNAIYLALLFTVLNILGGFGTFGYVAGILIICGAILWKKKIKFKEAKYQLETMIWGKPLKDFISEGERPPKIKISGWK